MLNKMIIIGRLGSDPDLRFTAGGDAVCNFSVAVSRSTKKRGEDDDPPMWVKVTSWRQQAENCNKFLRKGSLVFVDGKFDVETWQTNDGLDKFTLKLTADDVKFLSPKAENEALAEAQTEAAAQEQADVNEFGF